MAKALVVYASLTGTTKGIAEILGADLREHQVEVLIKECTEVYPKEFLDYDLCVVATYTYGSDGALPEEAEDFFYDLEAVPLSGKVFGVLGSGDLIYDRFCPSVDDFDKQFEKTQATRGAEPLKINLAPEDTDKQNIKQFAKDLVAAYSKSHNS